MDLRKRQLLQDALARAEAHHAFIAVSTPSGTRILLRPDFTCYETYVEGTGPDGQLLTLTYEQITALYQKRFGVEGYHKSLKQNAGLEKSPTRTERTQ